MKLTILLPCFLLSACVAACSKDDSAESAPADRTVMAADNEMQQLVESEKGDALAPEVRTNVKPVNKAQARQDSLSESGTPTPKGLLPP